MHNFTKDADKIISVWLNHLFYVVVCFKDAPDVNVLYMNLTEDDSKRAIQCLPKGEPHVYTYFQWQHLSVFHEHIRYLKARDDGIMYLPYVNISNRYQDTGFYICNVSNGVPDYHGNIFQQGREFIVSEGNQFSVRNYLHTHTPII